MTKQNRTPKVRYYLAAFVKALRHQLVEDEKRWGDTWLKRSRTGQEERIISRINEYGEAFRTSGTPVPWLKIAGEALIGWIRETYWTSDDYRAE